jgi:hypothetical protein
VTITTAQDLCSSALKLTGAFGKNDLIDAVDAQDALDTLNIMLESWSLDRTYVYTILQENFPLVSGTSTYTIGTGGTFNTTRPNRISNIFTRTGSGTTITDFGVQLLQDRQNYDNIINKGIQTGIVQAAYYEPAYPLATLWLWGSPSSGFTIYFDSWQQLQQFATLATTIVLPPGYKRAIVYSLAVELEPAYPGIMSKSVHGIATEAKAAIKDLNLPDPVMKTELGYIGNNFGGGSPYAWIAG